ncbi:MAG: hypothetical protein LBE97_02495 [Holosporales bacterium]|jgi:hypothetical protein|nr:hypothetical protein [Holosporales bacterium]
MNINPFNSIVRLKLALLVISPSTLLAAGDPTLGIYISKAQEPLRALVVKETPDSKKTFS